jgi:phosphohistidine phosphatase SixA
MPGVVLCSSSRRTADTLDGIRAALPKRARIELDDELYLADANSTLTRLHRLHANIRCGMLVGHNPGIEDLATLLVGSGNPEMRGRLAAKFPTSALVALSFDGAWADLGARAARIDALFMAARPGRDGRPPGGDPSGLRPGVWRLGDASWRGSACLATVHTGQRRPARSVCGSARRELGDDGAGVEPNLLA